MTEFTAQDQTNSIEIPQVVKSRKTGYRVGVDPFALRGGRL